MIKFSVQNQLKKTICLITFLLNPFFVKSEEKEKIDRTEILNQINNGNSDVINKIQYSEELKLLLSDVFKISKWQYTPESLNECKEYAQSISSKLMKAIFLSRNIRYALSIGERDKAIEIYKSVKEDKDLLSRIQIYLAVPVSSEDVQSKEKMFLTDEEAIREGEEILAELEDMKLYYSNNKDETFSLNYISEQVKDRLTKYQI
jgi:hypothetical protein